MPLPLSVHLDRATIPTGEIDIAALVYTPEHRRFATPVVLAHGLTASKESLDLLAGYLCGHGHACVTFDFRGHKLGATGGDLNHASEVIDDEDAVCRWAIERLASPTVTLVGHSMGAAVSLLLAARAPYVRSVVAISTGMGPSKGFAGPVGQALMRQRGDYVSGAGPAALLAQLDGLAAGFDGIGDRPGLFVAARGDVLVKVTRVRELADRSGPHCRVVEVDGSHLDAPDSARAPIASWLAKTDTHIP